MHFDRCRSAKRGFTLIELLVVIAVIAILAVVVIITLNPAELLRQSRDAQRLSDMATITSAISLYSTDQSGLANFTLGSSSTIYPSLSDSAATSTAGTNCATLGLLSMPISYSYHCSATTSTRSTTGNGWVPINFSAITSGAPFSEIPIDPTNQTSSRLYYTYEGNGTQYEVTAAMESQKYKMAGSNDVITADGGTLASVYEKGTKLGLEPIDYGDSSLIGYWTMDEGTGTTAYDYSGNNATDSWGGNQVGSSGYYSAGKIGPWMGALDGTSTYASNTGNNPIFQLSTNLTMTAWVKLNASSTDQKVISKRPSYALSVYSNNIPETEIFIGGTSNDTRSALGGTVMQNGQWYFLAGTYNGSILTTYVNGTLDRQISVSGVLSTTTFPITIGKTADSAANYFNGSIDDARVYNRALSAAEILNLYNGGK